MHTLSKTLIAATLGAATLTLVAHRAPEEGFGGDARPLTDAEMASSTGGVAVTVIKPTPTKLHYVQNPQLDIDVINGQNQSTSWVYLYHGTSKTGSRSIPTPAPQYEGSLQSRFMLRKGVDDLVIKYRDASSGAEYVSTQVVDQVLHPDIKVYKVVVHNVTTNSNSTNVSRNILTRAVDSQIYNQSLSVSDSVDAILAQCPSSGRIQLTLGGMDSGGSLHRITTGTNKCANLDNNITVVNGNVVHNDTSEDCMEELFAGSIAMDPTHENYHVFIVDDLPGGLNGFSDSTAQGAVIRKSEFSDAPWRVATLLLHEIGHGFGLSHRTNADPQCLGAQPHQRALMCQGGVAGKLLSASECTKFFTNNTAWLTDYN